MRRIVKYIAVAVAILLPTIARADIDATSVCLAMVSTAANNIGVDVHSSDVLDTVYDNVCESDGSAKSGSKSAGFSAVVDSLPLSLKGSTADSETATKNFCKNYNSKHAAEDHSFQESKVVVESALNSVNECLGIAKRSNNPISYKILTPSRLSIEISIQAGSTVSIHGISHESNVTCVGSDRKNPGKIITYDTAVGQDVDATTGSYAISCDRVPKAGQGDEALYDTAALFVDSNDGTLNILWPPEKLLPIRSANQLSAIVADLETRISKLQQNVDYNTLPIGALLPWFDKTKEPPKGWAKCDGSDTSNCPDLSNMFLLGGSLAKIGDKGGSDTMVVALPNSSGATAAGAGWSLSGPHFVASYQASMPKPPYVSVLYIKKINLN